MRRTAENPLSRLLLEIANKRMVVKKLTKTNTQTHTENLLLCSHQYYLCDFSLHFLLSVRWEGQHDEQVETDAEESNVSWSHCTAFTRARAFIGSAAYAATCISRNFLLRSSVCAMMKPNAMMYDFRHVRAKTLSLDWSAGRVINHFSVGLSHFKRNSSPAVQSIGKSRGAIYIVVCNRVQKAAKRSEYCDIDRRDQHTHNKKTRHSADK